MTQNSTLTTGPRAETLDFIRQFARDYVPQKRKGKIIILQSKKVMPLGEC